MQPQEQFDVSSARLVEIRAQRDGAWIAGRAAIEQGPDHLIERMVSLAGVLPGAAIGRYYALRLEYTPHPRYGDQYKILRARPAMPLTRTGLAAYMKHHIRGIGPRRAAALIDAFGVDLPAVLDAPDAAARVAARVRIPRRVLDALLEEWRVVRDTAELEIALHGAGCSPRQIARMHDRFGLALPTVASSQPYRLMEVRGLTFRHADAIARHFGCDERDPARCLAAVAEALRQETAHGHCWTDWQQVCRSAAALVDLDPDSLAAIVTALPPEQTFFIRDRSDRTWLPHLHAAHQTLVTTVAARQHLVLNAPAAHTGIPPVDGLTLTGEQEAAVAGVLGHAIAVLTGGPGTGKTTVVRSIINAFAARFTDPRIRLAAPTGKAAKRMSESCGCEATTVHRLLEWQQDGPKRDADNPVPADLVIIDEASMLDHELAAQLLRALSDACRVVFVGDIDQLPPVGPGQFLADVIAAGVATYRLSVVQRQAQTSLIVAAAAAIKQGRFPAFADRPGRDLYLLGDLTRPAIREHILNYVRSDIPRRTGIATHEIRVLIPQYRGDCGIDAINALLQDALNPPADDRPEIPIGRDARARVGDRLLWQSNLPELGLVNGTELTLEALIEHAGERKARIRDDDGRVQDIAVHQLDVRLAYALSIHKAQGSEYPACIVVIDPAGGALLNRRLVYTALTRARRLCVILGQRTTLARAISNDRDEARRSGLADDLRRLAADQTQTTAPDRLAAAADHLRERYAAPGPSGDDLPPNAAGPRCPADWDRIEADLNEQDQADDRPTDPGR